MCSTHHSAHIKYTRQLCLYYAPLTPELSSRAQHGLIGLLWLIDLMQGVCHIYLSFSFRTVLRRSSSTYRSACCGGTATSWCHSTIHAAFKVCHVFSYANLLSLSEYIFFFLSSELRHVNIVLLLLSSQFFSIFNVFQNYIVWFFLNFLLYCYCYY